MQCLPLKFLILCKKDSFFRHIKTRELTVAVQANAVMLWKVCHLVCTGKPSPRVDELFKIILSSWHCFHPRGQTFKWKNPNEAVSLIFCLVLRTKNALSWEVLQSYLKVIQKNEKKYHIRVLLNNNAQGTEVYGGLQEVNFSRKLCSRNLLIEVQWSFSYEIYTSREDSPKRASKLS